jgi:hypothetical protein
MTVYVPWGAIAIFVVLLFFYNVNRRNRLRKEERREKLEQMQEDLLSMLRKKAGNKDEGITG